MQGIFISYRRQDSQSAAGRLADDLKKNLAGVSVFRDVETIQPGMDFVDVINHALQSCGVLLAVIGPRWLTSVDSAGQRRLDNPDDFTRLEIATALKRGDVRVIPVLVEGAQMPEPSDLPEDLRALARRNALELTDNRWNFDVSRLVATVRQALDVPDPPPEPPGPQWRWPAAAIGALVVAGYVVWEWRTPPVAALPTSVPATTPPIAPNSPTSAPDHRVPSIPGGEGQSPPNGSAVQKPQERVEVPRIPISMTKQFAQPLVEKAGLRFEALEVQSARFQAYVIEAAARGLLVAANQRPAPGTTLFRGETVEVEFIRREPYRLVCKGGGSLSAVVPGADLRFEKHPGSWSLDMKPGSCTWFGGPIHPNQDLVLRPVGFKDQLPELFKAAPGQFLTFCAYSEYDHPNEPRSERLAALNYQQFLTPDDNGKLNPTIAGHVCDDRL